MFVERYIIVFVFENVYKLLYFYMVKKCYSILF
jgi:hypothetical protein